MSGLMVKDFRLLAQRKKLLVLYLGIGVLLGFSAKGMYIVSYLTFLGAILAVSTISYDEFDNGYSFMMSLPISPKTYAVQKHLFVYTISLVTWCIAVGIQTIMNLVQHIQTPFLEELMADAIILPVFFMMVSVILPVDLKYGTEKGKMVLFVISGLIMVVAFFGDKIVRALPVDTRKLARFASGLPLSAFLIVLFLVSAIVIAVSIACSIRVMQNREY